MDWTKMELVIIADEYDFKEYEAPTIELLVEKVLEELYQYTNVDGFVKASPYMLNQWLSGYIYDSQLTGEYHKAMGKRVEEITKQIEKQERPMVIISKKGEIERLSMKVAELNEEIAKLEKECEE